MDMHAHNFRLITNEPPCGECQAEPFCLQSIFSGEQLRAFKDAVRVKGPFKRGEAIYRAGTPFNAIYFIQRGAVKTEVCTVSGVLEVTSFNLVGELLGVDGIGCESYPADAVALEETWLCELPFSQIKTMCSACDEFHQALILRLGRTINADVYQWALARNLKAKQKVAWFIYDLFKRVRSRNAYDLRTIPLPMRKTDIANYLGLAPESLSRALLALEKDGMIVNESKHIYLVDLQQAKTMSMI
ncbi:MAG: helix-turn-helix domain-containing protein [Candidatus Thiodiazotropha sp. (ex Notomyrtea botanica)]|nr:helix-turn-helix domain-containing protein [Candidatus Thiodiazotropha sp. (ex Notomyrtea botanica)]